MFLPKTEKRSPAKLSPVPAVISSPSIFMIKTMLSQEFLASFTADFISARVFSARELPSMLPANMSARAA